MRRRRCDVELAVGRDAHRVTRVVELAREREPAGAARDLARRMRLRMCPVRGIGIQLRGHAGKLEIHAEPAVGQQLRTQSHDDEVAIRMHGGFDFDGRAIEHEAAREPARPHVQRLAGGGQIAERRGLAVRLFTRYRPRRPSEKRCGFSRSHWISGFFACSQSLKYGYYCGLPRTLMGTCACASVKPFGFGKLCQAHCAWVMQRHERRILLLERSAGR